ncbi:MAG: tyrosyl-tRNA synthetase, partial [Dehalococcoidia bacterium]|nr:tyrosyl-tRNA synthetase [Dehalococcoidia bacterium]
MYGKIMSIPDAIMMDYYELLTDVPDEELAEMRRKLAEGSVNPMEHKLRLAKEITSQFWGQEKAVEAEEHFTRVVREREAPEDIPSVSLL